MQMTPRQSDVLQLVAAGLTDKEIAVRLKLSQRTVRTHLERFYLVNGVRSKAAAVALFVGRAVDDGATDSVRSSSVTTTP